MPRIARNDLEHVPSVAFQKGERCNRVFVTSANLKCATAMPARNGDAAIVIFGGSGPSSIAESAGDEAPMSNHEKPFHRLTIPELYAAEVKAKAFLQEHSEEVAETMRTKAKVLTSAIECLALPDLPFDERMDMFAKVSELAEMIQSDAHGFFDLAVGPSVARIVRTVPPMPKK